MDALQDGPGNDGLIQRFQLLVWPDTDPAWTYIDRLPDRVTEEQIIHIFRTLVALGGRNLLHFRLGRDAQLLFVEWLAELEWKAAALNRLFLEQGTSGQPGRITAETVLHGERMNRVLQQRRGAGQ